MGRVRIVMLPVPGLALALTLGLLALTARPGSAAPAAAGEAPSSGGRPSAGTIAGRRAVIAFVGASGSNQVLDLLAGDAGIQGLGLLDPTLGGYNQQQALLDLTQGAWTSRPAYQPRVPPPIRAAADGRIADWPLLLARARRAGAGIEPGLLAGTVPGGAAYAASATRVPAAEAVVAADRRGRVAAVSLGPRRTLLARTGALLRRFKLVVVDLPGVQALDQLLARRAPDVLVLVLERPPPTRPADQRQAMVVAIGASGLPGGGGMLGSQTTRLPGLVTGLDVTPTVLEFIGVPIPAAVRGQAITRAGRRDAVALAGFRARLGVIAGRRTPTIGAFLLAWLLTILAAGATRGGRGARSALRVGGLAALWTPCTVLLAGGLAPSRVVEIAVVVGGGFLLAAVTDRLVSWPRGPVVPAVATLGAYAVDLWLGSPLVSVSLLGSNPIAGGRFFGVGNELEAVLPVILFAGLAAGLPQRPVRARDPRIFATAGLALTTVVAWGRLGADVGAVFTIGGGTAAGALMLRPQPGRRMVALACAVPLIGLLVLAGLDLVTGAGGHYTGTVLHAGSPGEVTDTIARKLQAAFRELRKGVMPINTIVCLAAGAYTIRHLDRILAPVGDAAGWRACLAGGFTGGVLGALANDSGPVLLVIATFGLGCVVAYVRGHPASYAPLKRP